MANPKKNNLVVLNEEAANDQLNATINVSNTDLVTMLVVKNRKLLQSKRKEIAEQLDKIYSIQAEIFKKRVDKAIEKSKLTPIAEAYLHFMQLLNPKLSLTYSLEGTSAESILQIIQQHYYYRNQPHHRRGGSKEKEEGNICYRSSYISLIIDAGSYEQNNSIYWGDGGEPRLPCNVNIKILEDKQALELQKELNRIDELLKNEKALKEEIVANLTEQAVVNSSMLSKLTSKIKMIE